MTTDELTPTKLAVATHIALHEQPRLMAEDYHRIRWWVLFGLLGLSGLVGCDTTREVIRVPGPVEYRDRIVEREIPPELLKEHPIATGEVSECPAVAAARKVELQSCNADKAALRGDKE